MNILELLFEPLSVLLANGRNSSGRQGSDNGVILRNTELESKFQNGSEVLTNFV